MAFPGLFKRYFLPWTPCCFVRLHTRLKTGNNAVEMSQAFHDIVRFERFTDLNLNMRSKSFKTGKRMLYNTFHSVVLIFVGSYGQKKMKLAGGFGPLPTLIDSAAFIFSKAYRRHPENKLL